MSQKAKIMFKTFGGILISLYNDDDHDDDDECSHSSTFHKKKCENLQISQVITFLENS
jgi:hypothetical protein